MTAVWGGAFTAGQTETVTRLRPQPRNTFGDPAGPPVEASVGGCLFAPGRTEEDGTPAANQEQADAVLYCPAGTDARSDDRWRVRGDEYITVGKPPVWAAAGVQVFLRLHTG